MRTSLLLMFGLLSLSLALAKPRLQSFLQQDASADSDGTYYVVQDADDGTTETFTYRDIQAYQIDENGPNTQGETYFILQDRDDDTFQTFAYPDVQRYYSEN